MKDNPSKCIAFVSSYPPRKCGIATFTSHLVSSMSKAAGSQLRPLVVALRSDNEQKYDNPVKFEIRPDTKSDYICAADYINFSGVSAVSIQHEFGLFGGKAGSHLTLLLNSIKAPIISTLHTVLEEPESHYRQSMIDVCEASRKIIVMNKRGVGMLQDVYNVPENKIELIPHGIPDLPFVDSNYYKYQFGLEGRRTILTFGLLSRNKGIEMMLEAMPEIIKADPSVIYVVLGMTHPEVIKWEGESYRFSLQRMVQDLDIEEHVVFHNRFVNDEELHNWLCAADLYVTPYLNREQLTSGTLAFAVGSGKAVVSTPYWATEELLSEGRGKIVDFGNSRQLAKTIVEILSDDRLFYSLRKSAYEYGRNRTWEKIGEIYWNLFSHAHFSAGDVHAVLNAPPSGFALPEPSLDHFRRLTDDTGMFQHASFTTANRTHGYCTDDNSRALIAMAKYYSQYNDTEALAFFDRYLSFIMYAQQDDGRFHNFMTYERTWVPNEPQHDALGRSLWSFGTVIANPPQSSYVPMLKGAFDKSVSLVAKQSPRGQCYCMFGMSDYLRQFPGASEIKRHMQSAADFLLSLHERNSDEEWDWFEPLLCYDNAVLPHALFVAYMVLGDNRYLEVAQSTTEFLLKMTYTGSHFSFVGCNGWFPRDAVKAQFDQQPLEAASTVMLLKSAYDATGDTNYLQLQRQAFDWFLGDNDLGIPLYDFKTKGCADGLWAGGSNMNQGAESMISFMLALLTILESYSVQDTLEIAQTSKANMNGILKTSTMESLEDEKGDTSSLSEKNND